MIPENIKAMDTSKSSVQTGRRQMPKEYRMPEVREEEKQGNSNAKEEAKR